jgi:cytochrome c-type biogenesis protein CcmH
MMTLSAVVRRTLSCTSTVICVAKSRIPPLCGGIRDFARQFRLIYHLAIALLVSVLIGASMAVAQGTSPDLDENVRSVAKQLNCPTCAGRNLADCPTETCLQWKTEIQTQLNSGKQPGEVITYFQDRFGSGVLQSPPKSGDTLALWLAPLGAALMLIGGGVMVVRRLSQPRRVEPAGAPEQDAYTEELERQVRENA